MHAVILYLEKSILININLCLKIITSCIVHCIVIQAGINMAYSTILENGLKEDFSATSDQISWAGNHLNYYPMRIIRL